MICTEIALKCQDWKVASFNPLILLSVFANVFTSCTTLPLGYPHEMYENCFEMSRFKGRKILVINYVFDFFANEYLC
jgi:hypothetical protein